MSNLENALQEFREKRDRAQLEVEKLNQVISGIESLNGAGTTGEASQPQRVVAAASRRKMALAQKARWATIRKKSPPVAAAAKTGSAPAKRKISAAGRKRMAAASRARWAKFRAHQKKAA
jgi:hypothetical protein